MLTTQAVKPLESFIDPNFCPIVSGNLRVSLATNLAEIEAAQRLRFLVFSKEYSQNHNDNSLQAIDKDIFDSWCDHLIVDDMVSNKVIGTYRLLQRHALPKGQNFYSASEFDLSKVLQDSAQNIVEVGRGCIHPDYRDKRAINLLWRALGQYININRIDILFGCASFSGADHKAHTNTLAYLTKYHLAPTHLRIHGKSCKCCDLSRDFTPIEQKRYFVSLPPLLRTYLSAGAYVGQGFYEDVEFNSTDMAVVLETSTMNRQFAEKFFININQSI